MFCNIYYGFEEFFGRFMSVYFGFHFQLEKPNHCFSLLKSKKVNIRVINQFNYLQEKYFNSSIIF